MQIRPFLLSIPILLTVWGCSSSETEASPQQEVVTPESQENYIQYEETLPDSGLLKDIDPEEIITDDWSDEGDLELDTDE